MQIKLVASDHRSGIYRITNEKTGQFYIGSSVDVRSRIMDHHRELRAGIHRNTHLQASYNRDGTDCFCAELLIIEEPVKLLATEQRYLDAYWDNGIRCFNQAKSAKAPMLGRHPSKATLLKQSAARLGRRMSEETKAKMSAYQRSRPPLPTITEETRTKMSKSRTGLKRTDEQKANMSAAQRSRKSTSEEGRRHMSEAARLYHDNNPITMETRAKLSAARKGKVQTCKHYALIDPSGNIVSGINLRAYCIENGLRYASMAAVNSGRRASCNGWTRYLSS